MNSNARLHALSHNHLRTYALGAELLRGRSTTVSLHFTQLDRLRGLRALAEVLLAIAGEMYGLALLGHLKLALLNSPLVYTSVNE